MSLVCFTYFSWGCLAGLSDCGLASFTMYYYLDCTFNGSSVAANSYYPGLVDENFDLVLPVVADTLRFSDSTADHCSDTEEGLIVHGSDHELASMPAVVIRPDSLRLSYFHSA